MNPGLLNTKIKIYDRGEQLGSNGYSTPEKRLVCTLRARRTDATTREVWEARAAKTRNVVNFECRRRSDIRVGMWVECGGQEHEIIALQQVGGIPGSLIIKTTLKEAI